MKLKRYENIDWDDVDVEEESQEEHVVEIPKDGETIVLVSKTRWKDFVKFCADYDFKWMNNDNVKLSDFDESIKDGYSAEEVDDFDDQNLFITFFSDNTIGFGYSDLSDPNDDYYYTYDEFLKKFVLKEHVLYGRDDEDLSMMGYGSLNYNKLYELNGNTLLVYAIRVEDDIKKKHKIECMYNSSSNGKLNMYFQLFENMSFKKLRTVKKYFLDTIPHCTNVVYDNDGFTVQLSRKFGLDVLKVPEY